MNAERLPKYAHAEIERRWLVDLASVGSLDGVPYRTIEDLYVPGTGLRLRRMTGPDGTTVFKFCKKYGKSSALSEAMTNLYLTAAEHAFLLGCLQGVVVTKRRHLVEGGAIDLYPGSEGLAVFEREFASEAQAAAYVPPVFATVEVTADPMYSGAALAARIGAADAAIGFSIGPAWNRRSRKCSRSA